MNIRWIYLPFLTLLFLSHSVGIAETQWTEKKLGKVTLRAAQAADRNQWTRAIKYGEQMLRASAQLDKKSGTRYLALLKNLNRYYDRAGRLKEIAPQVETAYQQSRKKLGTAHSTTKINRTLFYKLHISNRNYQAAIPLVLESISVLKTGADENYNHHQYLKQLYSLYAMTGQLAKEEERLLEFLELDKRLYGSSDKDNVKIIQNLANNYCRQKKIKEFRTLITRHQLHYSCK